MLLPCIIMVIHHPPLTPSTDFMYEFTVMTVKSSMCSCNTVDSESCECCLHQDIGSSAKDPIKVIGLLPSCNYIWHQF